MYSRHLCLNQVALLTVVTPTETESVDIPRKPRGPSQLVTDKVLTATFELLVESGGAALKIEAIAERSGVHKTTLYRRWGGVRELVKDAIASVDMAEFSIDETASLKEDLASLAASFSEHFQKPKIIAINRLIAGSRGSDKQLADWMDDYWQGRHLLYRGAIDRAIARGESVYADRFALAIEMMVGPMLLRTIMTDEPLDEVLLKQLIESAYRCLTCE